jgi:hypothetical protein
MKLYVLLGLVMMSVVLQSVAQQPSPAFLERGRVQATPAPTVTPPPKFAESEESQLRKTMAVKIAGLIDAKDYAGLDTLANDLRKSKIETTDGVWHLSMFYRVLTYEYTDFKAVPEKSWMERQVFLNKWVQTNQVSITARVALARFWKNFAWQARGTGYADIVNDAQWSLFDGRLKKAGEILLQARPLQAKCPVWWETMHFVALGQGWKVADYNALFEEAVKFDPSYTQFYNNKVMYLMPRWYGKEGEWQKFAAQAADKIGGEAGDILYARIGWRVHQRGFYPGFLRDAGYSWPRMKKGLQLLSQKHRESIAPASELAYLAYQAQDRESAKAMFLRTGLLADRGTWQNDSARFMRAWTWATAE